MFPSFESKRMKFSTRSRKFARGHTPSISFFSDTTALSSSAWRFHSPKNSQSLPSAPMCVSLPFEKTSIALKRNSPGIAAR